MKTLELTGHITPEGKVVADLPANFVLNDQDITITIKITAHKEPRKSLYGLWANLNFDITEAEIDEMRQDMWRNFPREDLLE